MELTDDHRIALRGMFSLSTRELDIVALLLEGIDSNAEIAERLGISPLSVKTFLSRIYSKMRHHSKLAVAMCIVDLCNQASERV